MTRSTTRRPRRRPRSGTPRPGTAPAADRPGGTRPGRRPAAADPADEPFLEVLRPLVETYFAFLRKDDRSIRAMGLTEAQFDVIATLGNTPGMSCGQLSERTLVTKGTLTGVLDRLEGRGLIERAPSETDRRSIVVRLTRTGDATFRRTFPAQIRFLKPYFERALSPSEMTTLRDLLLRLKESFERDGEGDPPRPGPAGARGAAERRSVGGIAAVPEPPHGRPDERFQRGRRGALRGRRKRRR